MKDEASNYLCFKLLVLHPSSFILHPLVDLRQQFSADILAPGGFAAHQTAGSGNNVDAVAAQHLGDFMRSDIHSPAGPRNSRQEGYG